MIIVHGLYGSGDNWISIARELSVDFEVYVVDLRNHGQSPHSPVHDYASMVDDLREFMDDRGIESAVLIGHSMGGKVIMHFAARWPERVASLVTVDIAPKSYHHLALTSHSAPNHSGMIDAMLSLNLESFSSREEIDKALSLKIGSDRVRSFLLKNVQRESDGSFSWKVNLKVLKENLDEIFAGMEEGEVAKKGGITGFPVLFVSGEHSGYIRAEDHAFIRSIFPVAEIVSIPDSGHWVHAEQPALLVKTLKYFLNV